MWLFSLGVGVANACMGKGSDFAAAARRLHCEATQSPDSQEPDGRTNCQEFCEKAGITIPLQKSALDDGQAQLAMPVAAMAAPVAAAVPTSTCTSSPQHTWPLPVRTVFMRLAL